MIQLGLNIFLKFADENFVVCFSVVKELTSKFSEFISPAELALVCLLWFILSFIKNSIHWLYLVAAELVDFKSNQEQ